MPKPLDISKLEQFVPKPKRQKPSVGDPKVETAEAVPVDTKPWPSREVVKEGSFTIRASVESIERFKVICKDDRRTYGAMLEILMNDFEKK